MKDSLNGLCLLVRMEDGEEGVNGSVPLESSKVAGTRDELATPLTVKLRGSQKSRSLSDATDLA